LSSACDVGDPTFQKLDAPPPNVIDVKATTSLDGENQPVRTSIAGGGMPQVLTTTSFTIRFDRFLLPASVLRQSICVQSKLGPVASAGECASEVSYEPTYDPTRREVTYRQSLTGAQLTPNTTYQLTVFPPVDETATAGFRAFDGAPLAKAFTYQFATVADPNATLEAAPTGDLFCTAEACNSRCAASPTVTTCQAACPADCTAQCMCGMMDTACKTACNTCKGCKDTCFGACAGSCPLSVKASFSACAFGGCHADLRDSTGAIQLGAAMGLNLGSAEGIAMTAVNRVARQTQQGEHADEPDRSPRRFGRAMPILDPGTPDEPGGYPGNSYLLYKLAVGRSATGEAAVDEAEIARLRASVVVGMPMPPPSGAPLRDVDLSAIADWIAQGAPTPVCP
jgi:hypothetical protein